MTVPELVLVQCLALFNITVIMKLGIEISLLAVVCYTLTCIYDFVLPVTRQVVSRLDDHVYCWERYIGCISLDLHSSCHNVSFTDAIAAAIATSTIVVIIIVVVLVVIIVATLVVIDSRITFKLMKAG